MKAGGFPRAGAGRKSRSAARSFREDCAGEGCIRICVVLLVLFILLSVVVCYAEQLSLMKTVKASVQEALDGMSMQASIASFEEENESENVSFSWDEDTFLDYMTIHFPNVEQTPEGYCYSNPDGVLLWKMTRPDVAVEEDGNLHLAATYVLTVPTRFGGISFPDIEVTVRVNSGRMQK